MPKKIEAVWKIESSRLITAVHVGMALAPAANWTIATQ